MVSKGGTLVRRMSGMKPETSLFGQSNPDELL